MDLLVNRGDLCIDCGDDGDSTRRSKGGGNVAALCAAPRASGGRKADCSPMKAGSGAAASTQVGKGQSERAQQDKPTPLRKRVKRSDPVLFEHLLTTTVASRARLQCKYMERKKREEQESPVVKERSPSATATNAGLRLYTLGMGKLRHWEKVREEAVEKLRKQEEKLTFKPWITSTARLLSGGYKPPHECYQDVQRRITEKRRAREQRLLRRFESDCTFQPTLEANSVKIAEELQKDNPFTTVGERLCFEGGCRLVRQQLRRQILEHREQKRVISGFSISSERACRLVQRLYKWQRECDKKREATHREFVVSPGQPLVSCRRPLSSSERSRPRQAGTWAY